MCAIVCNPIYIIQPILQSYVSVLVFIRRAHVQVVSRNGMTHVSAYLFQLAYMHARDTQAPVTRPLPPQPGFVHASVHVCDSSDNPALLIDSHHSRRGKAQNQQQFWKIWLCAGHAGRAYVHFVTTLLSDALR